MTDSEIFLYYTKTKILEMRQCVETGPRSCAALRAFAANRPSSVGSMSESAVPMVDIGKIQNQLLLIFAISNRPLHFNRLFF